MQINKCIGTMGQGFRITAFLQQGQADLLKHAKAEVQENMKQVHDAALTGNLTKQSTSVRRVRSQTRGSPDH